MYVIPTPGRAVPDPVRGDLLPPEGRNVDPGQFWDRRLNDGDIVIGNPPPDLSATKQPPKSPA